MLAAIDHPKLYARSPRATESKQPNQNNKAPVIAEPDPQEENTTEENGTNLKKRAQTPRPPRKIEVILIVHFVLKNC